MALPILDGNQSATTLSSILTSGEHIPAHTVVSLGTQAITDMQSAVSGSVVSISNFPATQPVSIASVTIGNTVTIAGTVTANPTGTQTIAGTVSLGIQQSDDTDQNIKFLPIGYAQSDGGGQLDYWVGVKQTNPLPVYLPSTYSLPAGTNRIGVVTIGAGTVTIGAGTAQIGSVTVGNSVTIGSLPAISGTVTVSNAVELAQALLDQSASYGSLDVNIGGVGSVTLPISGTVTANAFGLDQGDGTSNAKIPIISFDTAIEAGSGGYVVPVQISNTLGAIGTSNALPISGTVTANTFAVQGTAVTTSNFTSTTASTVLAGYNAGREVLTIFNEGAGNLHICAGATCTTIAYQVRLSAGDYYEVPNHQTTITHSAVFATAGTARVTQVS